jgi:hypothetical protein
VIFSDGYEGGTLSQWTVRTGAGGTAVVQSSVVKTGTKAVRLTESTAGGSYAYIRRSLGGARTAITTTLDVRLATEGAAGANVPLLRLFDASGNRVFNLFRQNASANRIYVGFGGVTYQTTGLMPLSTWTSLSVRVVVNGSSSTVVISANGATIYSNTAANLGSAGITEIQIGNETKRQAFDLAADNVTVRQP